MFVDRIVNIVKLNLNSTLNILDKIERIYPGAFNNIWNNINIDLFNEIEYMFELTFGISPIHRRKWIGDKTRQQTEVLKKVKKKVYIIFCDNDSCSVVYLEKKIAKRICERLSLFTACDYRVEEKSIR